MLSGAQVAWGGILSFPKCRAIPFASRRNYPGINICLWNLFCSSWALRGLPGEHVPQSVIALPRPAQDKCLHCPQAPTRLLAAQPRSHLGQQLGTALPAALCFSRHISREPSALRLRLLSPVNCWPGGEVCFVVPTPKLREEK